MLKTTLLMTICDKNDNIYIIENHLLELHAGIYTAAQVRGYCPGSDSFLGLATLCIYEHKSP